MFAGDWIDWVENLLLFSPSGIRKTHRATGICRSLMAMDCSGRFFTATTLVQ
jgi:DNA replication protein DnaC